MSVFGRRAGLLLLICMGLCAILWSTIHAADDPQLQAAMTRKTYADKISQTYSFPFAARVSKDYGDSAAGRISLPGNAAVEGSIFIEPSAFPDAPTAATATRRRITSGARPCTPMLSARLSIEQA